MTAFLRRIASLGLAFSLLPATSGAGKKEDLLQADVDEIQRQVFDLKRQLDKQGEDLTRLIELLDGSPEARAERARFNANVDALRGDLRALGSRFDDAAERLGSVERAVAACQRAASAAALESSSVGPGPLANGLEGDDGDPRDPGTRTGEPPASGVGAEGIFKQASGDYIRGNLDLAIGEFRNYLQQAPDGQHAAEARYGIAMSLIKQRKLDDAVRELDTLVERHPRAANVPDALYRKGESLLALNRVGQAVLVFNDVVSRFPESAAATQASERLRELAAEAR